MTVVAMVSVGFLLAVVVLAAVRVRGASRGGRGEEPEMVWDDSALNITVNPMQVRHLLLLSVSILSVKAWLTVIAKLSYYGNQNYNAYFYIWHLLF